MIELKRHGSFLCVDSSGYVVPVVNESLIQPEWTPIIAEVVDFYKAHCAENLMSVYVRGSVAKGEAVDNVSDLDTFCVVSEDCKVPSKTIEAFGKILLEKFPFSTHTEICFVKKSSVFEDFPPRKRSIWAELIKTQSICVYGNSIAHELLPFHLKDMIGHAFYLRRDLEKFKQYFEEDAGNPDDLNSTCIWICRRVVRAGFDLVMLRENKFTRDLYLCYESFSKYFPERENEMRMILHRALHPTDNKEILEGELEKICPWLVVQIEKELNF